MGRTSQKKGRGGNRMHVKQGANSIAIAASKLVGRC